EQETAISPEKQDEITKQSQKDSLHATVSDNSNAPKSNTAKSNKPEQPVETIKSKLAFPKLGDISISSHIPNLDSIFEEKKVDESKGPEYIMGDAEEVFNEQEFMGLWNTFANQVKLENKISI